MAKITFTEAWKEINRLEAEIYQMQTQVRSLYASIQERFYLEFIDALNKISDKHDEKPK